jgi:dCMP deaminase
MSVHDETWNKCPSCNKTMKDWHYYHGPDGCMIEKPKNIKETTQKEEPWLKQTLDDAKSAKEQWPEWAKSNNNFDNYVAPDWDSWFLEHVYLAAKKSKDPKTKIGAVLVRDNKIISTGFNGFPIGVQDLPERYQDRNLKHDYVAHAEANAIVTAARLGICTNGAILYTQGIACNECCKIIIQGGIIELVVHNQWPNLTHNENWVRSINISKIMLREAGIRVVVLDKVLGVKGYLDGKILDV